MVPGTIMFSLLALVGQALYNRADAKHSAFDSDDLDKAPLAESIGRRLAKSKWSPVKVLSDEEYERMLREKLLHVNAEIAIIDEGIERLQESAYSTAADVDGRKSS